MNEHEPWTVLRLLEWTTGFLTEHGSPSPRLDAEVLLAKAMDCERIDLYTRFDQEAGDIVRAEFRKLVKRRAGGAPVAYLVGQKEFYSRSFLVTPDVLVPRPETEFILVELLDLIADGKRNSWNILDLGTGSGILAVCAATELPAARVVAVDISDAALRVAHQNAIAHEVADRVDLLKSDLFDQLPENRQFDFVISNPPYITSAEYEALDPDVREHEPATALVAGTKGTEVICRIISGAASRLEQGGWLILEVSPTIVEQVLDQLRADHNYGNLSSRSDLAGLPRIVKAQRL